MPADTTVTTPTQREVSNQTRSIIVGGLAVGAALGFTGNFFTGTTQSIFWAVSAIGLIVAGVTLAVQLTTSRPLAAIGFLLFALGETRILNPTDVPTGEASFAAGASLYAPGLILIALSGWAPVWSRVVGVLAGLTFGAHAMMFFAGAAVGSTGPIAGIGYMLLVLAIIGWIIALVRRPNPATRHQHSAAVNVG